MIHCTSQRRFEPDPAYPSRAWRQCVSSRGQNSLRWSRSERSAAGRCASPSLPGPSPRADGTRGSHAHERAGCPRRVERQGVPAWRGGQGDGLTFTIDQCLVRQRVRLAQELEDRHFEAGSVRFLRSCSSFRSFSGSGWRCIRFSSSSWCCQFCSSFRSFASQAGSDSCLACF